MDQLIALNGGGSVSSAASDSSSGSIQTQASTATQANNTSNQVSTQSDSATASNGSSEIRVPMSQNSIVDIVNGGVRFPDGVQQQFIVTESK
jgi:hypothetical protein